MTSQPSKLPPDAGLRLLWADDDIVIEGLADAAAAAAQRGARTPRTRHNRPGDHPIGHEFGQSSAGLAEAFAFFNDEYPGLASSMTKDQERALGLYQISSYGLNAGLRHPVERPLADINAGLVPELDSLLAAHSAPRNFTVYRGTNVKALAARPEDITTGSTFIDRGYSSTSWRKHTAIESILKPTTAGDPAADDPSEGPLLLKVIVTKGTHGIPVDVAVNSVWEREFLLPRSMKYEVLRVETVQDRYGADLLQAVVITRGETP